MNHRYKTPIFFPLIVFLFLAPLGLRAQFNYSFSATTSAYTSISGGTTLYTTNATNSVTGGIPIGFTFSYNCTDYNTCRVSTAGWIDFNTSGPALSTNQLLNAPLVIAPLWD